MCSNKTKRERLNFQPNHHTALVDRETQPTVSTVFTSGSEMQSMQRSRGALPFSLFVLVRPGPLSSDLPCVSQCLPCTSRCRRDERKKNQKSKMIRHPSASGVAAWQPWLSLHKSAKYADALTRPWPTGLAEKASSALFWHTATSLPQRDDSSFRGHGKSRC